MHPDTIFCFVKNYKFWAWIRLKKLWKLWCSESAIVLQNCLIKSTCLVICAEIPQCKPFGQQKSYYKKNHVWDTVAPTSIANDCHTVGNHMIGKKKFDKKGKEYTVGHFPNKQNPALWSSSNMFT